MKDRALYLILRLALGVVGAVPRGAIVPVGRFIGTMWCTLDGERRRMARRHLRRVLGSEPTRSQIRAMFQSYGRYWAETLWFRPKRLDEMRAGTVVENDENLEAAIAQGRGCVIALPHMGNWELAAPITWKHDAKVVAVAENLGNPLITEWFTSLRAEYGIEIVLTGRRTIPKLRDALKRKRVVTLLCDRDLSGRGTKVVFFGEQTTMPAGPVRLAQSQGVPLIAAGTYFEGDGHRVVLTPEIHVDDCSLEEGVQRVAEELERLIRRQPTQWHMLQPNWPSDRESSG